MRSWIFQTLWKPILIQLLRRQIQLNSAFQQLGDTWQDQQRQSFEETYQQLQGALSSFKENASNQIPHLRTMAEDLRTYLGR